MKKGDYIIIGIILIITSALFFITQNSSNEHFSHLKATIFINNTVYKTIDLNSETQQTIQINESLGSNTIKIENNAIWIEDASCPDKICVLDGKIYEAGEILVCLPHKLLIEIEGYNNASVDDVTY